MEAALVLIENDGGNNQADQYRAHNRRTKTCRTAVDPLDLHPKCPVPDAVSEGSDKDHLLQRENTQRG